MPQKVLQLVSVGSPPPALLRELEDPIALQLGLRAVVSKTALPTPAYAFNKDRGQYHCNAIMRRLATLLEPGPSMVLGITDVDLFVPDSPFVLGEADRESRSAVLSLFRLRQGVDGDQLRRRLQVEAVHQAGHLLGLSYCEDARCVMFFAQAPQDCDRKQMSLCNNCRNELNKLNR
ncbi:non-proteolytic archaemetzincin-like protein [Vitiosangium sp. GDMCC 1.1324]|uniref:non-proteolytic archaemetzincin-like protein n=1 Tax=Vitiosangium sp. (strain GDMCC 1.1324) TaxID=2138576 RepID=UPI000D3AD72B|nr:non-proteolytic archaemetzincin-like protein [Vitiosangium sp. GDMCC 1.1324]PTL85119.1 peptidase M54 [Vitiosangium sp. GDMCC 1.1324]